MDIKPLDERFSSLIYVKTPIPFIDVRPEQCIIRTTVYSYGALTLCMRTKSSMFSPSTA
jgi:hypothetical protein